MQSGNVTEPRLATRSPLPISARAARFHNLRKIRQPDQRATVAGCGLARQASATDKRDKPAHKRVAQAAPAA